MHAAWLGLAALDDGGVRVAGDVISEVGQIPDDLPDEHKLGCLSTGCIWESGEGRGGGGGQSDVGRAADT